MTGVSQEPPRGVWGHAPPGKFGKMDALRLNLVKFWSKKCTKSHSDSKKRGVKELLVDSCSRDLRLQTSNYLY